MIYFDDSVLFLQEGCGRLGTFLLVQLHQQKLRNPVTARPVKWICVIGKGTCPL
jgi:hypothetical protein